jgi:hypothetical protein
MSGFVGSVNGILGFLTATHCERASAYKGNDDRSIILNLNKFITDSLIDYAVRDLGFVIKTEF